MYNNPMYAIQSLMGSELFALWSLEEREWLHEMLATMLQRTQEFLKHFVSHGVGPLFGYVGPELCIPPLQSPRDFKEFVHDYDRHLIDIIHDAGGIVWVHSHGRMHDVLEMFADMGADVLHPLEPPSHGDITLREAKLRVGHRMCLEGNMEIADLHLKTPDEIGAMTLETITAGKPGGGYVFATADGPSHGPVLDPRIAENYRVMIETVMEYAWY